MVYTDDTYGEKAAGGAVITLTGALPEGAEVKAYPVEVSIEDKEVLASYDITIFDADGAVWQPDAPLEVTIALPAETLADVDAVDVYHMEREDAAPELVAVNVSPDGPVTVTETPAESPEVKAQLRSAAEPAAEDTTLQAVTFEAESFSIYVITKDNPRVEKSYTVDRGRNLTLHCDTNSSVGGDQLWSFKDTNTPNSGSLYISMQTNKRCVVQVPSYAQPGEYIVQFLVNTVMIPDPQHPDDHRYDIPVHTFENFKIIVTNKEPSLSTVDAVPNNGITLNMFNYNFTNNSTGNAITQALGGADRSFSGDGKLVQGLVNSSLTDGYPVVNSPSAQSLAPWFSPETSQDNVVATSDVTGLFQMAEGGYYEYDSTKNFAALTGNTFTLYEQLGTPDKQTIDGADVRPAFYFLRGNFMPYNSLDIRNIKSVNQYTYTGEPLPENDARYGEAIYGFKESNDFYFGMSLETDFMMPAGGQVDGGDMIFEYTGDDDMWVFIDDVLVLDLGGVHDAQSGEINFATGKIKWTDTATSDKMARWVPGPSTLGELLNGKGGVSDNTLTDYSVHTLKMFYMERGDGASNLRIRFNLPTIPKSDVTIQKVVDDQTNTTSEDKTFTFHINYDIPSDIPTTFVWPLLDGNNNFTLSADETKVFPGIPYFVSYTITELNPAPYTVTFNGEMATLESGNAVSTKYQVSEPSGRYVTVTNKHVITDVSLELLKMNQQNAALPEARFRLEEKEGEDWTEVKSSEADGLYTTDEDGKITFTGLRPGEQYRLTEVTAPEGYNLMTAPIPFTVEENGTIELDLTYPDSTITLSKDQIQILKVINYPAYALPGTGGIGTTMFKVVGVVLMVGAVGALGAYLFRGKKGGQRRRKRGGPPDGGEG